MLTFSPASFLDGRNVVFGEVIDGYDVVYKLSQAGTDVGMGMIVANGLPRVTISKCGDADGIDTFI